MSWNDYGESTYIGPLTGSIPAGMRYADIKTDHAAWADLTQYYASWFKTGAAPAITSDRVYMWARTQPKNSGICSSDGIGSVQNADWADELLYVSVFLKSASQVSCYSGSNKSGVKNLKAGATEFTVPLSAGAIGCSVTRNGAKVIDFQPKDFTYTTSPATCNMNAWTGLKRV